MKKYFRNRKVPFGILGYFSSANYTTNKIFRQGLKKEYLTFSTTKSYGTHPTLWR